MKKIDLILIFLFVLSYLSCSSAANTNVAILLDRSGSMKDTDKSQLRLPALHLFLSILSTSDSITAEIYTFSDRSKKIFSKKLLTWDSLPEVIDSVDQWPADGGGTTLSNALSALLQLPERPTDIVLLSDAHFNRQEIVRLNSLKVDLALRKIKISVLGLAANQQNVLSDMAQQTNGLYQRVDTSKAIKPEDWQLAIVKLALHINPPDVKLISTDRGIGINQFIRQGVFITSKQSDILTPNGRRISGNFTDQKTLKQFIVPSSHWTILAVTEKDNPNFQGTWRFHDKNMQPTKAAFIGSYKLKMELNPELPARIARDEVLSSTVTIAPKFKDIDLKTSFHRDLLENFTLELLTYPSAEKEALGRVSRVSVNLLETNKPILPITFWEDHNNGTAEISLINKNFVGRAASVSRAVELGPQLFVYEAFTSSNETEGSQAYVIAPKTSIEVDNEDRLSIKVSLNSKNQNPIRFKSLEGTITFLRDGKHVFERPLSYDKKSLNRNIELENSGEYEVEIEVFGRSHSTGQIPILEDGGDAVRRLHTKANFQLIVSDKTPPQIFITPQLNFPKFVYQGQTLSGMLEIKTKGEKANEIDAKLHEIQHLRFQYNVKNSKNEIVIENKILVGRIDKDKKLVSYPIEINKTRLIDDYHFEILPLNSPNLSLEFTGKSTTYQVLPGLIQFVLKTDRVGYDSRAILDSYQASFANGGIVYLGEKIYAEIRKGKACGDLLFQSLGQGLEAFLKSNGMVQKIEFNKTKDVYRSEPIEITTPNTLEAIVSLMIAENPILLQSKVEIQRPQYDVTVKNLDLIPKLSPAGLFFPIKIALKSNVNNNADNTWLISRLSVDYRLTDLYGVVVHAERLSKNSDKSEWNTDIWLSKEGPLKISFDLIGPDENIVKTISKNVQVIPSPLNFVNKSAEERSNSKNLSNDSLRWLPGFLRKKHTVTVQAVTNVNSQIWHHWEPDKITFHNDPNKMFPYDKQNHCEFETKETELEIISLSELKPNSSFHPSSSSRLRLKHSSLIPVPVTLDWTKIVILGIFLVTTIATLAWFLANRSRSNAFKKEIQDGIQEGKPRKLSPIAFEKAVQNGTYKEASNE